MKNTSVPSAAFIVRALPGRTREDAIDAFYLPKEAKARINRFAHHEAERHGQAVRNRIWTSLGTLADQGKPLPDLLAALTAMTAEPDSHPTTGSDELRPHERN